MTKIFRWLIALFVPLALLTLILKIMLTPLFVQMEYRLPWFPADPYGMTQSERLHWAPYALHYLTQDEPVSYLGDLHFEDGTPLFNARELSHMADVQKVVQGGLRVGGAAWFLLLLLGFMSWRTRRGADFKAGLHLGGWLTLWLVLFSATFGALSFSRFFTAFHRLFFEGDSWLFYYSDTLIRLFPIRFWEDAFALTGLLLIASSLALIFGLKPAAARRVISSEDASPRTGV